MNEKNINFRGRSPTSESTSGVGLCGRARSIVQAGVNPASARQVSHRVASTGQAEVTPNVKHGVSKAAGRKRKVEVI